MIYFVTVCRLKSPSKMGELVKEAFFNKYNRSLVTDRQLREIPAEIAKFMTDAAVKQPRLKMLNISVHGMALEILGCPGYSIEPGERGAVVQVSVHGENKGYTDSTAMRLKAEVVISDLTGIQEGGEL